MKFVLTFRPISRKITEIKDNPSPLPSNNVCPLQKHKIKEYQSSDMNSKLPNDKKHQKQWERRFAKITHTNKLAVTTASVCEIKQQPQ